MCIFAYGQTGSGKTHTMQGSNDPDSWGLIPRSLRKILRESESMRRDGSRAHASEPAATLAATALAAAEPATTLATTALASTTFAAALSTTPVAATLTPATFAAT